MEIIMNQKTCLLGVLLIILVSIAGCFAEQREESDNLTPIKVTVADILSTPDKYSSVNLSIDGKISSQCGSGCWFILSDDTGDLYVNLKPENFVIPPSMGKNALVNGTILEKNGDIEYIGSVVLIDGKSYP